MDLFHIGIYFYIISPYTHYIYESGAWYVTSSGDIDNYSGNVRDSYGRIQSPYRDNSSFAYCATPSGDVISGHGINVDNSYGRKYRRTRSLPAALGLFSLQATSTSTTSTVSTIPTVSRAIGPSNPYKKYWWLRSPMTGLGVSAFLVISSGNIYLTDDSGSSVHRSYGRIYLDRLLQILSKILVVRRTRATPTSRIMSSLPVTSSATTATMSTFPTGERIAEHELGRWCVFCLPGW